MARNDADPRAKSAPVRAERVGVAPVSGLLGARSHQEQAETLLAELFEVYREVDEHLALATCPASTECCRFGRTRREPYVTSLELLAVERARRRSSGTGQRPLPLHDPRATKPSLPLFEKVADEGLCPMLGPDGRCVVYAARPFGCRTFFCERADVPVPLPHKELLAFVRRIKELAIRHAPRGDEGRPLRNALGAPKRRR
jgi:uncharacterized protein